MWSKSKFDRCCDYDDLIFLNLKSEVFSPRHLSRTIVHHYYAAYHIYSIIAASWNLLYLEALKTQQWKKIYKTQILFEI